MMNRSITLKLLPVIIGSFILLAACVLLLAKSELTKIIDKSQQDIFAEKIDVVWGNLKRMDDRLQKTGLVEAYREDFENSALKTLQESYYKQLQISLKPIIIDQESNVILHPDLAAGESLQYAGQNLFQGLQEERGDFYTTDSGSRNWHIFRVFRPWGWIILYVVPLEEKYSDVRNFSRLLFLITGSITLLVVSLLSLTIAKLMRPIRTLTHITSEIAQGHLDHPIAVQTRDEIGVLASSFDRMRNAVKLQLTQLSKEIETREKIARDLLSLERYLSDIINSMPSAIIGIDGNYRVTQWNSNVENMTGITAAEAYGKSLENVYPELEELYPLIAESLDKAEARWVTKRERQVESGPVYEDLTIYPLAGGKEEGTGAVIRIDDVTKEYELEQQLSHSSKMDAIGQLAGGIAHDFNNMLAGILGPAQMMQLRIGKGNGDLIRYLTITTTSTTSAADLHK